MFTKYPVIYYLIIVYVTVKSQICSRTEVVTSLVLESYITTRLQYYPGKSYPVAVSKYVTSINLRTVPRKVVKKVKICCPGYIRIDDSSDNSDIACDPICVPGCINGYCTSPGKCACNTGYIPDSESIHSCLPVCEKHCNHGTCVAPNTCRCSFGYSLANDSICQPICTEPCHNSTCVSPETCECIPGYRKSDKNICKPYCSNGCDNGVCTSPETCTCNTGWHETSSDDLQIKICKPFCSKPCENGTCVAPETCECLPGYKKTVDYNCEPKCKSGWKLEGGECVPECKYSCGNGKCFAPNVCHCFSGYNINLKALSLGSIGDGPLCIPTCHNCKGTCVAPNTCLEETSSVETNYETSESHKITTERTSTDYNSYNYDYYGNEPNYDTYDSHDVNVNPDYIDFGSRNNSVNDTIDNKKRFDDAKEFKETSWMQQHWELVVVPLVILITAGLMMLLVMRWKPIIEYFKGRSYTVEEGPPDNGTYQFEDIQISSATDKEMEATK